jgi:hypothetical protein
VVIQELGRQPKLSLPHISTRYRCENSFKSKVVIHQAQKMEDHILAVVLVLYFEICALVIIYLCFQPILLMNLEDL